MIQQLIRSLKDELSEMKKKAAANQKLMQDISHVRTTHHPAEMLFRNRLKKLVYSKLL